MEAAHAFWNERLAAAALPWGWAPSPAVDRLAAQIEPGARVLVPGCGYGRNALALGQRGFDVTGYDFAAGAIARARAEAAHSNVEYAVRDVLAPCEPGDGSYDAALCHFFLHLFRASERRRLVETLAAALRPGGLLLATGLSTQCPFFGKGEELEPDTWSNPGWVPIHFYTPATLAAELAALDVLEVYEWDEPEETPAGRELTPPIYALAVRRAPA